MSASSPDKTKDAGQKAAASSGQDSSVDEDFPTIISKMEMHKLSDYLFKLGYIIKYQIDAYAEVSQKASHDLAKLADDIHTGFKIYEMLDGLIHKHLDVISEMFDGFHKYGVLDGTIKCDSVQQGINDVGISGVSDDYVNNVSEKDGGLDLNELRQRMEGLGISGVSDDYFKNVSEKYGGLDLIELKQEMKDFGISGVSDDSLKKLFGKDGVLDLNDFKELMESLKEVKNILKKLKEDIDKMMSYALQYGGPITGKMDDTKDKLGGEKK